MLGQPPFGYKIVDRKLVKHPENSKWVKIRLTEKDIEKMIRKFFWFHKRMLILMNLVREIYMILEQ